MRVTRLDNSQSSIFPRVITVESPTAKYQALVKFLKFKEDELGTDEYRRLFIQAIYLFLKGDWSLDELAAMANDFWTRKNDKNDELADALYACAELIFYVRSIYDPEHPHLKSSFNSFMKTMIEFYAKNIADVIQEAEPADDIKIIDNKVKKFLGHK